MPERLAREAKDGCPLPIGPNCRPATLQIGLLEDNLHGKSTSVYTRSLKLLKHSFFFGPRGTCKTTWLRKKLRGALRKNLLLDEDYLALLSDREPATSVQGARLGPASHRAGAPNPPIPDPSRW